MQLTSKIELNTQRSPKKSESLVLKTYELGVTTINNQPIGSTPFEAIGVLKEAIAKLEEHGATLHNNLKGKTDDDGVCECMLRSLAEKSELPYGCAECCADCQT